MDTERVERGLVTALAAWAAGSLAGGAALARRPATRRFGRQTVAWGVVDALVAGWGAGSRRRRGPSDPARLRRVLQVNLVLDAGYVAGGAVLLRSPRARARGWEQDGGAVVVQGLALLALDGWAQRALAGATDAPER